MKYLHLVWASLFRKKTRTVLTMLSIFSAFLLFGLLSAVSALFSSSGTGSRRIDCPVRLFCICSTPL